MSHYSATFRVYGIGLLKSIMVRWNGILAFRLWSNEDLRQFRYSDTSSDLPCARTFRMSLRSMYINFKCMPSQPLTTTLVKFVQILLRTLLNLTHLFLLQKLLDHWYLMLSKAYISDYNYLLDLLRFLFLFCKYLNLQTNRSLILASCNYYWFCNIFYFIWLF